MFGGCHRGDGFLAAAITAFTTWPWRWFKPRKVSTHSSVGFVYPDGRREIYEAREGQSWQGPIAVETVQNWVARKPKKRRFTMYDIPAYKLNAVEAARKLRMCKAKKGVWKYSLLQLPRMGLRKYVPFLRMRTTPNAVVCSEAAALVFAPQVDVCKLTGKSTPDAVTPADFEQAMQAVCKKPKTPDAVYLK